MDKINNWVFDLDDTLYPEIDYVRSAFDYIGMEVTKLYGRASFAEELLRLNALGLPDPIADAWLQYALPEADLPSIIIAMRAHTPKISLSQGAQSILEELRRQGRPFSIVTDGRSVTQRKKIAALGCNDAAYVSILEEVGLSKLDTARFAAVAERFSPGQFWYVGDNPAKDFFVPRQLGWKTVMLDHQGRGVHAQKLPNDAAYHPDIITTNLLELVPLL